MDTTNPFHEMSDGRIITTQKKKYELKMIIDNRFQSYLELRRNQKLVKCSKMLCFSPMLWRRDTGDCCGGGGIK